MAKFHGDRPRELGDPVAREKKTSASDVWERFPEQPSSREGMDKCDAPCTLCGIATVSRPSVCLSVRDVHVPWPHKLG